MPWSIQGVGAVLAMGYIGYGHYALKMSTKRFFWVYCNIAHPKVKIVGHCHLQGCCFDFGLATLS